MQPKMKVSLKSVGNPDHRQNSQRPLPGVPSIQREVGSLAQASAQCLAYIKEHDLGAGNWAGGQVTLKGVAIAEISYNGRAWTLGNPRLEIPLTSGYT